MKSEKEKAQVGELYDANNDPELLSERDLCKNLCFEYNRLPPFQKKERAAILKRILENTSETLLIEQPFYCDYGYNIEIGSNFYANMNCIILDEAKVSFGNNVFIAPGCGFYTAGHPLDVQQRNKGLENAYTISIGKNVWIGAHVCVLPGVTIGDNTVIGAGSVVTKNIPANVLAAGNPCKVIRVITEEDKQKYK
ncbi:MAG: sugar O-acetyltransferase [Porphyromonadaceae bacterium]|nr:sugar O-acetyltransferase [Porphyromonadaceae bacterium]